MAIFSVTYIFVEEKKKTYSVFLKTLNIEKENTCLKIGKHTKLQFKKLIKSIGGNKDIRQAK